MIKVLHLRDTDRICGPGKTILESCTRIDTSRYELSIGLFLGADEREADNAYLRAARERGIEVLPLRSRGRMDLRVASDIARLVREQQFDVVHTHEYKSDLLGLLAGRLRSVPLVSTAHGWITNSLKSRLLIGAGKRLLRYFDSVIAVSPAIRDELVRLGVPADRVRLIHNAIVVENYQPQDQAPGALRRYFDLPDHARIIGNVGRLSREKGQADFIAAAARIARRFPQAYFVLIGDGPDRAALERLAAEQGIAERVLFTGHHRDIRPFYRDLDALALTSYTEGFPNVLLEALCMGKPVLATRVGGVPDIVEDHLTGHLVEPGAVDAIAHRLEELLERDDLSRSMVEAGRARIRERFEFGQRMQRVEALYDEVLGLQPRLAHARARH